MKIICKLTFAAPTISAKIINGMLFQFPCTCMIKHVDEAKENLITQLKITSKKIDIQIDETLLKRWGFLKWQFDTPNYYQDLFAILFHYIKQYLYGNFTSQEIPDQLLIKFNEQDFTEPLNMLKATLEHPEGTTLKMVHSV